MSLLQKIQNAPYEVETDMSIPPVEDKEELIGRIAESITAKDSRTLQAYVLEQRLPDPDQFWELTTLLAPCLTTENQEEAPQFFTTVRRCLTHFSRHGKPKEMVLAFLEQVEAFRDDALFIALLPCLQNALLQLPVKRGRSLELALDTLGFHIKAIPSPRHWTLEGEPIRLMEFGKIVRRFLDVVPAFLDFMQPFLGGGGGDGGGWCREVDTEDRQWERRVLKKHLLQLLEHPLAVMDLRYDPKGNSPKSYSREVAETVVRSLTLVESNFYYLLVQNPADGMTTFTDQKQEVKKRSTAEDEVEDADVDAENAENELKAAAGAAGNAENKPRAAAGAAGGGQEVEVMGDEFSTLAGACLAYLVQVEWLGQSRWPKVHTHAHLFHANLPYVHALLTNYAHKAAYKGLSLLAFYLDLMDDQALDVDTLDDDNFRPMLDALIGVMRFRPIHELRLQGLAIFKTLFSRLDYQGRHQLMKSVLASCEHAGVKAVVVSLMKTEIDSAIRNAEAEEGGGETAGGVDPGVVSRGSEGSSSSGGGDSAGPGTYFLQNKLKQLLELASKLKNGACTNLLDESDLIMATLNLLRYLVLRDTADHTGVWSMLPWLETFYFSALRVGLDISMAHYQLELKNLTEKAGSKGKQKMATSVSVEGVKLPLVDHEQEVNIVSSAITTFDMMKCVLARLAELIDQRKLNI